MRNFKEYLKKKQQDLKFDSSELSKQYIPYFENGQRIEVDFGYEIKRGYVGVTSGWKPSFILLLRSDSIGSSYLLNDSHKIVKTLPKYKL